MRKGRHMPFDDVCAPSSGPGYCHWSSVTHAHGACAGSVGRSLTSCIGENGTHNHLPHAKAFVVCSTEVKFLLGDVLCEHNAKISLIGRYSLTYLCTWPLFFYCHMT